MQLFPYMEHRAKIENHRNSECLDLETEEVTRWDVCMDSFWSEDQPWMAKLYEGRAEFSRFCNAQNHFQFDVGC